MSTLIKNPPPLNIHIPLGHNLARDSTLFHWKVSRKRSPELHVGIGWGVKGYASY